MTTSSVNPGGGPGDQLPSFRLVLFKVTSVAIYTSRAQVTFTGTMPALEDAYRKVRRHNLLAGWWGFPFGLAWTPLVLFRNRTTMRKLRQLAASSSPSAPAAGT